MRVWAQDANFPSPVQENYRGKAKSERFYNLLDVFQYLQKREQQKVSDLQKRKLEADVALAEQKAIAKELENKITAGEVIPLAEAIEIYKRHLIKIRQQIEELSSRLAMRLAEMDDPNDVFDLLQKEIDRIIAMTHEKD